jgi:predicted RNase H-like HicB family nuclease
MKLFIVIEEDRHGFFVAEVPSLPGCFSLGRTPEEALTGMHQVVEEWFEIMANYEPEHEERVYSC